MDAAFFFAPEGEHLNGTFYGRLAANDGLLAALARMGSGNRIHCVTPNQADLQPLARFLMEKGVQNKELIRLRQLNQDLPARGLGTMMRFDPNIGHTAWIRRADGADTDFSLCGLTHSLVETDIMRWLGEALITPLRPWDALVCTTRAAQSLVANALDQWRLHLAERLGFFPPAARKAELHLPIIPLGIDATAFLPGPDKETRRQAWRRRLGLTDKDVAVLFFGRLSYFEKAHPAPLYLALEEAVKRTGKKLHLVQCGRFPESGHADLYRTTAQALMPSVPMHLVEGSDPDATGLWFAADIFASLSDNVQETFGLTPVEAMAAGLPAVVSDWDGYRDTVVHGETGFRIDSTWPRPDEGGYFVREYYLTGNYHRYLGKLSQRMAVNVPAAAEAFARLAEDEGLRRRMGDAGRRRVAEVFDWPVIVRAYETLFAELRSRRDAAVGTEQATGRMRYFPVLPDPFKIFGAFPTFAAEDSCLLRKRDGWEPRLQTIMADPLCTREAPQIPYDQLLPFLKDLPAEGSLGAALDLGPADQRTNLRQLFLWLAKMDVVTLTRPET